MLVYIYPGGGLQDVSPQNLAHLFSQHQVLLENQSERFYPQI